MGGKINLTEENIIPFHAIKRIVLIPERFYGTGTWHLGSTTHLGGADSLAAPWRTDACFATSTISSKS